MHLSRAPKNMLEIGQIGIAKNKKVTIEIYDLVKLVDGQTVGIVVNKDSDNIQLLDTHNY